jgi:hypothetical protein
MDGVFVLQRKSSFILIVFQKGSLDDIRYSVLTANMARNWFRDNNFTVLIVFFEPKRLMVSWMLAQRAEALSTKALSASCRHG